MFKGIFASVSLLLAFSAMQAVSGAVTTKPVTVSNKDPRIYYHGRWDDSPGTWWAGSGFKLHVKNLKSLTLNLGNHTTTPFAAVGVSVNYGEFVTFNVSEGANPISLGASASHHGSDSTSVVRVNVEGWQNNRINLKSIVLNSGASLQTYKPSKLAFQFIGDSLSAGVGDGSQGQFLPKGVDQAWPFLVGEHFKAEHSIAAQPGAALTDIFSYGNVHGVSYEFFKTEDTGYYYTTDHNYTTPWNFARDKPTPTHIVIHIGANDAGQGIADAQFIQVYLDFLKKLRTIYKNQPIFVFTPWGWPNADGTIGQYYEGDYQTIVNSRHASGDKHVFLVNTTGWVTYDDVFAANQHPNIPGHQHIADQFNAWLKNWGLKPESKWATPA